MQVTPSPNQAQNTFCRRYAWDWLAVLLLTVCLVITELLKPFEKSIYTESDQVLYLQLVSMACMDAPHVLHNATVANTGVHVKLVKAVCMLTMTVSSDIFRCCSMYNTRYNPELHLLVHF